MTPERWQKIKEIVHGAATLAPGDRPAFLKKHCGADALLMQQVLSLLSDDTSATSGDAQPLNALFERSGEYEGRQIGGYTVERELGRGGMGVVLLGRNTSDQPVALKLLRRSLESREAVLRFHNERLILSELDHPHIATVLEGGTTHEGLHYLVMEYVEGQPIDTYCNQHKLDTSERLELVLKVLDALDYAHQRGVIHRDIKPGNILVSDEGHPVLLDFGIAKMNDPDSLAHGLKTVTGQWLMTPEYAAPEQVKGVQPTPACDIYAMGMLLYELLTGHRPYYLEQAGPAEVARIICEDQPCKPSKVLDRMVPALDGKPALDAETVSAPREGCATALRRALRGNLDNILLAALEKDPTHRYADAAALAADLRNHLAGRPLELKRAALISRAGKWLTRNRTVLQAAYALAFVVIGFTSGRVMAEPLPAESGWHQQS